MPSIDLRAMYKKTSGSLHLDNGPSTADLSESLNVDKRRNSKRTFKSIVGASEIRDDPIVWRQLLAELLGTSLLVFIACGSCLSQGFESRAPSTVQIALTFGLTVASIVQAIGHISGGHINPAVTMGMLVTGNITVIKACLYISSQCIGSILGSAILYAVVPHSLHAGFGRTNYSAELGGGQALCIEIMITFFLVFVVFASTDNKRFDVRGSVPLAIGLSVTACHLFAVPFTGSSMNPARSFGPAMITMEFRNHYVYWVGPMLGGSIAGVFYKYVFTAPEPSLESLEKMVVTDIVSRLHGKDLEGVLN